MANTQLTVRVELTPEIKAHIETRVEAMTAGLVVERDALAETVGRVWLLLDMLSPWRPIAHDLRVALLGVDEEADS